MSPELKQQKDEAEFVFNTILRRDGLEPHDRAYLRNFFKIMFETIDKAEQQGFKL